MEESRTKVSAFVKESGVKQSALPPLFCELGLARSSVQGVKATFDGKLYKDALNARAAATNLVEDSMKASSSEVKDAIAKHSNMLSSLDKGWKMDMNFWLSQCGKSGEERVFQLILDAMPTPTAHTDLSTSVGHLDNIVESKLFQFVFVSLQSNVHTIHEWLKTMRDGRAPKIPNVSGNKFFTKVVEHWRGSGRPQRSPARGRSRRS